MKIFDYVNKENSINLHGPIFIQISDPILIFSFSNAPTLLHLEFKYQWDYKAVLTLLYS